MWRGVTDLEVLRSSQRFLSVSTAQTLYTIHRCVSFYVVMDPETVLNVLWPSEPIENDLARQVEYDMDEQGSFVVRLLVHCLMLVLDQEWLDSVNGERKKEQIDMVSCETFEIIMDRLEKEWFDLVCLSPSFFIRSGDLSKLPD